MFISYVSVHSVVWSCKHKEINFVHTISGNIVKPDYGGHTIQKVIVLDRWTSYIGRNFGVALKQTHIFSRLSVYTYPLFSLLQGQLLYYMIWLLLQEEFFSKLL